MALIDITPTVRAGMAVFPGDAACTIKQTFAIGPECPVNVTAFSMSTHCGAHADAPLHYDAQGKSIDQLDLEDFIGPARVVDARGTGPQCHPEDIATQLENAPPRLLLRLEDKLDPMVWPKDFRTLAPETVEFIAARGVRLIGVDVPSVDSATSKELPAHMKCRQFDLRILENLVLSDVTPGDYDLIALPMKLEGLDAAPVRAVLRTLDSART
ncbi:arylformamidase [Roseibium sp. CAU 1637]|uniref:Kynurenine formamidase n=1 Tax=Roseibium limicola TaxID=2816037 RepID=A0A939J3W5_9HYPH|nr:arylformamidase [Roseibium limicola]MBO0344120.1 arylformamidase [Roseibium limicola]